VIAMKIDELLRRLENFEIENEKYEIAEYLIQTLCNKKRQYLFYIMMKDKKTIYDIDSYGGLLESNKVSPDDAYVFIENDYLTGYDLTSYFYPFLVYKYLLLYAYLSKLGFEYYNFGYYNVVPATGLKYVSTVKHFLDANRTVVEVVDIDTVAINMNLPMLIRGSTRNIGYHELIEIASQLKSQKLFAGYDFNKAWVILYRYYENHDTSLAKEVEAIKDAYNRIFKPFRVECKYLQPHISTIPSSI
jgi:hypothetical protein